MDVILFGGISCVLCASPDARVGHNACCLVRVVVGGLAGGRVPGGGRECRVEIHGAREASGAGGDGESRGCESEGETIEVTGDRIPSH